MTQGIEYWALAMVLYQVEKATFILKRHVLNPQRYILMFVRISSLIRFCYEWTVFGPNVELEM